MVFEMNSSFLMHRAKQIAILLGLLSLALLAGGCMTAASVIRGAGGKTLSDCDVGDLNNKYPIPRVYSGSDIDLQYLLDGVPDDAVMLYDLPLSLGADTALLPYTIVMQSIYGNLRETTPHYVADKVSGWSRTRFYMGVYSYHYHLRTSRNCIVVISGQKKGSMGLKVSSNGYDPFAIWKLNLLRFSDEPIKITFNDPKRELIVPSSGFKTLHGQILDVGNSTNFTIIVPSFRFEDKTIPELPLHIRWLGGK